MKPQVPRWTSATPPAGNPAQSAASHPLLLVFGGPEGLSTRSTFTSGPVAVPSGTPESNRLRRKSVPLVNTWAFGETRTISELSAT